MCTAQVRVYTKKVGHKPDFTEPVVLTQDRGGTTMEAMCKQIHHQLTREFKYALVWGVSAKHSPQRVGLTHQLADEDVVQVRGVCVGLGGGRGGGGGRRWGAVHTVLGTVAVRCLASPWSPAHMHTTDDRL
jgi:hypothetical protein